MNVAIIAQFLVVSQEVIKSCAYGVWKSSTGAKLFSSLSESKIKFAMAMHRFYVYRHAPSNWV